MMWQPGAAQTTAFQQAAELVADAVGEPSLRVDPSDPNPVATLIARAQQLPPSKRKSVGVALAGVCVELLRTASLVPESRATHLVALALTLPHQPCSAAASNEVSSASRRPTIPA
jgi:hypothetical protein